MFNLSASRRSPQTLAHLRPVILVASLLAALGFTQVTAGAQAVVVIRPLAPTRQLCGEEVWKRACKLVVNRFAFSRSHPIDSPLKLRIQSAPWSQYGGWVLCRQPINRSWRCATRQSSAFARESHITTGNWIGSASSWANGRKTFDRRSIGS